MKSSRGEGRWRTKYDHNLLLSELAFTLSQGRKPPRFFFIVVDINLEISFRQVFNAAYAPDRSLDVLDPWLTNCPFLYVVFDGGAAWRLVSSAERAFMR